MKLMTPQSAPEERLHALGLVLPEVPEPIGEFRHGRIENGLLFLSGQGPLLANGQLARGKVGRDVTTEEASFHAMRTGLVLIAVMKSILHDLDRVQAIVKLLGFVNSTEEYSCHSQVIDGCSNLFHSVFGDIGPHARSAIGLSSLPGQISVEVEAIVRVSEP